MDSTERVFNERRCSVNLCNGASECRTNDKTVCAASVPHDDCLADHSGDVAFFCRLVKRDVICVEVKDEKKGGAE